MLVPVNTSIRYPLFLILILSVLVSILVSIGATTPSVSAILNSSNSTNSSNYSYNHYDDVISHQNNSIDRYETWSLGNNISEGDYYEYKICNDYHIAQMIYPYHCYIINLEFVTILESYKGKVWVVQGNFTILGSTLDIILGTTPHTSQQMIFLIDSTNFKVDTDILHKDIGVSIQNTIFSLSQYGEKSLSIGTIWDYMDSYFTNTIPLEIKNKQTIQVPHTSINTSIVTGINGTVVNSVVTNVVTRIVTNLETSVLSYDVIVPSNIYLHESFPFPLKAVTYSPHIIYPHPKEEYYFELLDYSNEYSNYYSNRYGDSFEKYPSVLTEDEK